MPQNSTETELVVMTRHDLQNVIKDTVIEAMTEFHKEQTAADDPSNYYSVKQLSEKWNVCTSTIWRLEKLNKIHGTRVGHRVLFTKEEIETFEKKNTRKGKYNNNWRL